ncbi:ADP-ribose pyrophosphatase (MutT/nudix family) [Renibacterium salmoninarum ATCC 33209]|uniref:ADP-ribose pyrophosphatase (MutT/nudix family) n=1 Tax=Renibacterium salmoninarum (strain ATCC 33209 / DSM 20767 / JCM 11484 / NBRC 15589 / NCIMB 2235) TaxID=288705 RepID=A9WNN4_RENSM|nr:NUDIX domain-containing protein [Renibacterium salmoninarum]ABY23252.1 ADP-ribose pyrophosphatase (MutT/nudix family) [Renibacterium salmoninarum ATCC 33209]
MTITNLGRGEAHVNADYANATNVSERQSAPPTLAISTVIFALREAEGTGRTSLWLPLVCRIREPFKGQWALPGGPLSHEESLQGAAGRNLAETTGLKPLYLEQLYAFGGLQRAASCAPNLAAPRVVSIVHWALVQSTEAALALESDNVRWFKADSLSTTLPEGLAFDHNEIVDYALWRLRNKIEYGSIAYHLLGEKFTLAQVREVYEAVLGRELEPANFRRQLKSTPDIAETDEYLQGGKHRPPKLYRYTGNTDVISSN